MICFYNGEDLKLDGANKQKGISRHLKNVQESGESYKNRTAANFATVQNEGNRSIEREIEYYKLGP